MIEHTIRLFPPEGQRYALTSYTEWIGHDVDVPSLDRSMRHVLRAVENAEDGSVSTLTVQTYSDADVNLTANLSIRPGTPKAQVRAHNEIGGHLVTAHLDAPLHEGQTVDLNGSIQVVREITYPYRDPADPESTEDYQHVTLHPTGEQAMVQSLGPAAGILGLLA
jgi:hypothetical protein